MRYAFDLGAHAPEIPVSNPGSLDVDAGTVLRLLLVDDADLGRLGFRALAEATTDMVVVGEARSVDEALPVVRSLSPGLILVATDSATMDGLKAIRLLTSAAPGSRVVAVSRLDGDESMHQSVKAGARGYIVRSMSADAIVSALRNVHAGRCSLPWGAIDQIAGRVGKPDLTSRERQVLLLIAEGWGNAKIAANLGIAVGTVKIHVRAILAKLGADDRTEAAALAWRRGFVQPVPGGSASEFAPVRRAPSAVSP